MSSGVSALIRAFTCTGFATPPNSTARGCRWIFPRALRIFSYTAAAIPVIVGTVLAGYATGSISQGLFFLVLIASICVQAGTNLSDEYFDYLRGVDREAVLGFKRILKQHLLTPKQILIANLAFWFVAVLLGLYIVRVTGIPILAIALLSAAAGLLYAAGPLGHFGLGELTVFIFMGPVIVMGSYYVQTRSITWDSFWISLPVAFLVAAILQVNNIRDIEEDKASGKRTLATVVGRMGANVEYYILLSGAYLLLLATIVAGVAPGSSAIAFATLPIAVALARRVGSSNDSLILTNAVKGTAQLHSQFGLLFALGIALASIYKP